MSAKVGIVLVSHSGPLAEGTAELAGQVGGGAVTVVPAGGTDDGRIGTSIAKVQRALQLADGCAGVVILPDLGSSVLTVRTLLADDRDDLPGPLEVADAPFVEGAIAGCAAAGVAIPRDLMAARDRRRAFARALDRAFALRDELRSLPDIDTIVCRCESVPLGALDRAWTPRQAKLYARVGMGPCQGRVCGVALEYLYGWPLDMPRPPVFPTSVRALV